MFGLSKKFGFINHGKFSEDDTIAVAQADFALKLLCELYGDSSRSLVVSPVSVAILLSMVYAGAKGKTAKEIGQLLANG